MIRVSFYKKGDLLTGFECKGHADTAAHGEDILCAFVSSACYLTANTVTEVIRADAAARDADGFMRVSIHSAPERAQDILNGLLLHMTELQKEYPDKIKVMTTEE